MVFVFYVCICLIVCEYGCVMVIFKWVKYSNSLVKKQLTYGQIFKLMYKISFTYEWNNEKIQKIACNAYDWVKIFWLK